MICNYSAVASLLELSSREAPLLQGSSIQAHSLGFTGLGGIRDIDGLCNPKECCCL